MTAQAADDLLDDLVADTVRNCSTLVRFDTSNFGGGDSAGEREAAQWVAEQLAAVGYDPEIFEPVPGRASAIVRIPGQDRQSPALLVHGHLDTVPAAAKDWSFDPWCGDVRDGAVWGRGALDMKDMDAMMLSCATSFARTGFIPPRDIVLAFVADEEDTGAYGAGYLVGEHPDLFRGVTTAIGESGGHSLHLPDGSRIYPIATAERGSAWLDLVASGPAGHGSRRNPDNAVAALARAVARLADHQWPLHLGPAVTALVDGLSRHLDVTVDLGDPASVAQLGDVAPLVNSTISNSVNPTMLSAGYKHNVIPSEARAGIDGRIVPGAEAEFLETLDDLLGTAVSRSFASFAPPVATSHESAEFALMTQSLLAHDAQALVLPFCMAGGTDAKAFTELGIACYGFAPGRTPPGFHSDQYVHGVDEHVLVDSLAFGVRVLDHYLRSDPTHPNPERATRDSRSALEQHP